MNSVVNFNARPIEMEHDKTTSLIVFTVKFCFLMNRVVLFQGEFLFVTKISDKLYVQTKIYVAASENTSHLEVAGHFDIHFCNLNGKTIKLLLIFNSNISVRDSVVLFEHFVSVLN